MGAGAARLPLPPPPSPSWLLRPPSTHHPPSPCHAYQEELRATNAALDNALAALRPVGQRFALALGATAPEPQERGLGMQKVAELKEGAAGRAAVVLSQLLAERDVGSTPAGPLRDVLSSAASLVLQLQAWAVAPMAPSECRYSLLAALNKLAPAAEANKLRFQQVLGVTLQLQDILCGVSLAELKPELKLELGSEARSEAPLDAAAVTTARKSPAKLLPSSPTDPP